MKRYLIFAHDKYYPFGGMDDMVGMEDTEELANQIANKSKGDFVYIVDTETMKRTYTYVSDWCIEDLED